MTMAVGRAGGRAVGRRDTLVLAGGALATALAARRAAAQDAALAPGIVYAVGEKFDGSFNEGAYRALEAFRRDTGIAFVEYQPKSVAEFGQGLAAMARRGVNFVVVVGFYYAQPLSVAAAEYPDMRFVLVDAVADAPNVLSVTFREQEGAYLTGVIAAMASKTGTVGFVAAIDIPLIRKFVDGFGQGAKDARGDIAYLVNFIGSTPEAFNDPTRAGEIARSQIARGADVIFAGAGNSNQGVFQAARDAGVFAIGVDSNQNGVIPGTILTSMLKHVDVAVTEALRAALAGDWRPGARSLGLAEHGVGWALDGHNRALVTPAMEEAARAAETAIVEGRITVVDPTAR
jgi:basic membrane protein A